MNAETASQSPFAAAGNGPDNKVHRAAQKVHEAVDTLEQKIGSSSERVIGLQQEYGDMAREQVRANPLIAVGAAFAAGFILAKLFR